MTKPKDEALRYNDDKLRFELIPIEFKIELARIFSMGAIKYPAENWRKGMSFSKCIGAMERHEAKWLAGEEIDAETGCHHLSQVAWNALVLMYYSMHGVGEDDRHKLKLDPEDLSWGILDVGLSPEELEAYKKRYKKGK